MLRLQGYPRGAVGCTRRKHATVGWGSGAARDGTTGRLRPSYATPPFQEPPQTASAPVGNRAGSKLLSAAPPSERTSSPHDDAKGSSSGDGWGPLGWLRWGPGGHSGSIPEVNVSLTEAASEPTFALLNRLFKQHGPIFRMKLGPKAFYVISDPSYAKQILVTNVDKYNKGILAEIMDFVVGKSLLTADGEQWAARRRAVAPALQRKFVSSQVALFASATRHGMQQQLETAAATGGSVDMESFFSRLSLDVVGKAIFDYDFDSLTHDDPAIEAVYTVLTEAEARSKAPFPYWKLPGASLLVPRLRESDAALQVVNDTLDRLVAKCKAMVDADGRVNTADEDAPSSSSVLYFLLASGEPITSRQLRNDLMTLLIAGHETTAAALTWALHLLADHPQAVERLRREVDSVLGDRLPSSAEDLAALRYTTRVVCEALRLYPQPPLLIRRCEQEDVLGGVHTIPAGSDLFISVWNLHHDTQLWDEPEEFSPERFGPLEGPQPSESNTDYRYMPFGGGRRKCVGDQFALMQAATALALLLRRYDFKRDPAGPPVGLAPGATINTTEGLFMVVTPRDMTGVPPPLPAGGAGAAAAPAAALSGCPHAAAAAAAAAGCPHAAAAAAAAASVGASVAAAISPSSGSATD